MARPVLSSARFWAASFLLGLLSLGGQSSWAQSQSSQCSPGDLANLPASRQHQVRELEQRVEAGPFYRKMLRQLGKPNRCDTKLDGENIALSYVFRDDAHLDARVNSSIEYSEQRAEFLGLSREKALALLKKGALDSFGREGCGIDWNQPQEQTAGDTAGSRATVFRGDSCNCQARIVYRGDSVVALVLSSAC